MSRSANFEAIKSTKNRMPADVAELVRERKGKRNKPVRHARVEWDFGEHHKTNVGAKKRYAGEELTL